MSRSKPVETPAPDDLSAEQRMRLWEWFWRKYPRHFRLPNGQQDTKAARRYLNEEIESILDWYGGRGIERADWLRVVRRLVAKNLREKYGVIPAAQEPRSSKPAKQGIDPPSESEQRQFGNIGEVLAEVLPLFGERAK